LTSYLGREDGSKRKGGIFSQLKVSRKNKVYLLHCIGEIKDAGKKKAVKSRLFQEGYFKITSKETTLLALDFRCIKIHSENN
jgi:hypothetical protein